MNIQQKLVSSFHLLKNSGAIRQSVILTAGTAIGGIVMAVAMIVASKLLGPEKFGIFSVSMSLAFILAKIGDFGLHQLIPRLFNKWFDQPIQQKHFLAQVIRWKLVLSVAILVLGLTTASFLMDFLHYPYLSMILFAVFGAVILSTYEYVYVLLSAEHKFSDVSLLTIAQAVIKSGGFILLFILGFASINAISIIYYGGPLLAAIYFFYKHTPNLWVKPEVAPLELRSEMFSYLPHMLVGVIMMTLIANLDVLLVQKYLNPFETGIYAGASRIASFIGFLSAAVGGVLSNRVARYRDAETFKSYLKKSLSIVLLAVLGFLCFLPLARLSIILTIGPEYISGLNALLFLVANAFVSLAIVPFTSFFYGVDEPWYFSVSGVAQVLIIVVGNVVFLPTHGIMAAALSRTAANIIFAVFTLIYICYVLNKFKKSTIARP